MFYIVARSLFRLFQLRHGKKQVEEIKQPGLEVSQACLHCKKEPVNCVQKTLRDLAFVFNDLEWSLWKSGLTSRNGLDLPNQGQFWPPFALLPKAAGDLSGERAAWRPTLAGCRAIVHQHLDQILTLMIAVHHVGH